MTVLDLITDSLQSLGEVGPGEGISPEDAAFGLLRLNALLDALSLDRLYIPAIGLASYSLVPNKATYQIGPSAQDFNISSRPIKIESAAILIQVGSGWTRQDITSGIISEQEYVAFRDLGAIANSPEKIYCDYAYPIATLNLYPAPTCVVATKLELGTWSPVAQFSNVNQTVTFPPGYYSAILWNLCLELSPGYDLPPNPLIQARADEGKRRIAALNMQQLPPAVRSEMAQALQAQQQPPQAQQQ